MGRPYQIELNELDSTYRWARDVEIGDLRGELAYASPKPLIAIGSGGSLSSACLASSLHQQKRFGVSYFDTPLLASRALESSRDARFLIVSARGKNPDVLGFARAVVATEASSITSLCCMPGSPLSQIVGSYSRGTAFEFDPPSGKDGYLATNSLVALNTILARAYSSEADLPSSWAEISHPAEVESALNKKKGGELLSAVCHSELILLFGPETRSAAIDFESKFCESGLASIQIADYRNFAHGRHLWLERWPATTVIMFICPSDKEIAQKTKAKLPKICNVVVFETNMSGAGASFAMQAAVFEVVASLSRKRGWDPGRPSVPDFGRKLYHLSSFPKLSASAKCAAIARKEHVRRMSGLPELPAGEWSEYYEKVKRALEASTFARCVLDYDGTLCDHRYRFGGLPADVARALIALLEHGINIGIATGRGKSVRKALCEALPRTLWSQVFIAFYNGSLVLPISDAEGLEKKVPNKPELARAASCLHSARLQGTSITERPYQVTLESTGVKGAESLWRMAAEALAKDGIADVQLVMSSRSVDVLPKKSSKLNILRAMPDAANDKATLFIGDQPAWPGNDYELLNQPSCLSVDEVSLSLDSGWNMASPGVLGSSALVEYLGRAKLLVDSFHLRLT